MASLAVLLMGQPRIELHGAELKLKRKKALGLLAYLAATRRSHTRDSLAELFYPDLDRERAYSDLRQLLSVLRSEIGASWVEADRESVRLVEQEGLRVDLWELEVLATGERSRDPEAEAVLLKAAELVRGPFLSGFYLKDSAAFEDWQSAEAERIKREEASVLERLLQARESRGEHEGAVEICGKLLALDPLAEEVHRRLMRLYAAAGKRAAALKQFDRCKAILLKELGEKPSRETEELRNQIAAGQPRPAVRRVPEAANRVVNDYAFVGREREMMWLRAAADQAAAGSGRLIMVVGDPGIGKTRMIEEAAAYAESRGARVLWGTSHEDMGLPAYWPWRQMMGRLVREAGRGKARQWSGPRASVLAEAVGEIGEALGDLPKPPALADQESERFRLWESVDLFLAQAASDRPLVLILDDLHWADRASLALLEFVARGLARTRTLILGTCRESEVEANAGLAHALGELGRLRWSERIDLGALDRSQVAQMAHRSSDPDSSSLGDLLWEKTQGNPLFVVEYLRSRPQRPTDPGDETIPPNVCAVIRIRTDHLDRDSREALHVAAAVGTEFTAPVVAQVLEVDGLVSARLLDAAVRARIIAETPGSPGSYRFSHPLIRECLAAALSGERRAVLHARLVAILERTYGDKADEHAAEIVHHCALGQPSVPPGKLSHYSLLAGEHALASAMDEEALFHFRRGLAAKGLGQEDAETAWLRFGLARAICPLPSTSEPILWAEDNSNAAEALGLLTTAFDYFSQAGDAASAIRVAQHPLLVWNRHTGEDLTLFARGLALAARGSVDEARFLWLQGLMGRDPERTTAQMDRSLLLAEQHRDVILRDRIILARAIWYSYVESHEKAAKSARRAVPLLAELDDPRAEIRVRMRVYHVATAAGDIHGARREVALTCAAAERLRDPFYTKLALLLETELESLLGNWDAARTASDRAIAEGNDPGREGDDLLWQHVGIRILLEMQLGEQAAGQAYLERYEAGHHGFEWGRDPESAVAVRLYGWTYRLCRDPKYLVLARKSAWPFRNGGGHEMGVDAAALVAALTDDLETARLLRASIAGRESMWLFARRAECLGRLDMTLGDTESSVAYFDKAIAHHRAGGFRPLLAWASSDCAEALLRRGSPEDKARAASYLREAGTIARLLGMTPLGKRIRSLEERT